MITKDEVESLLEGLGGEADEDSDNYERVGWGYWLYEGTAEFTLLNEEYMARTVQTKGGSEGGGSEVVVIVEFTPHVNGIKKMSMESRYFEKLGFYGSYYGVDFDGTFTEVFPKQKTVTVYEKS